MVSYSNVRLGFEEHIVPAAACNNLITANFANVQFLILAFLELGSKVF